MYSEKTFDFKIKKSEVIRLNRIIDKLALLSDLDEIQELNWIWSNVYNRNMYGYSLNREKFINRSIRFYNEKKLCEI